MAVTAAMVKELRERTGAGMMECKKALVETSGDMEAAVEHLRKSGLAQADNGGTGTNLGAPRDNVKGGSVASRRPGLWVSAGIGRHIELQNQRLPFPSGATPVPLSDQEPSLQKVMLVSFLEGVFDTIDQIILSLATGAILPPGDDVPIPID